MKLTRKIMSLALCLMLVLSLAAPVFAAEPVSLTIQGEKANHTYEAYQIFSGDINASGVMTNIVWGTGIADGAALLAALKADTTEIVNGMDPSQVSSMATEFAAANNAEDVAKVMKNWGDNAERIDYFANFLYEKGYLTATPTATTTSSTTTYVFSSLQPGYYLIKDEDDSIADTAYDFYTKFIIDLTTSTDVAVKGSVPKVDKKVSETLTGTYSESISNQLNKTHYYEWTGYIPADIEDYEHYYYKFTDTMSKGLTFERFEKIVIAHAGGSETVIYDASLTNPVVNAGLQPDVMNHVAGADSTTVVVEWTDLLAKYPTLLTSDKIVVKYSAHLNEHAVIGGAGNDNKVNLTFSNNPHDIDDKGKTPDDDATVYSFKLKVNKVNQSDEPLAGAEFVLFHYHTVNTYAPDGVTITGTKNVEMYAIVNAAGKITGWTEDINVATKLTTLADGLIKVEGLKDEIGYFLRETKAPDGYNKLNADIKIVIDGGYTTNATDDVLSYLKYEVDGKATELNGADAAPGEVSTKVINKSGTTLPSTGGIGTTLFYLVGGLMVAAAAVLLVTKKRMSAQN